MVTAPVIRLFITGGPFAVFRRIRAIVIYAFDGVFGAGACAHISQKVLERVPALTDRNTATAVIRVGESIRVVTSGAHCLPDVVFGRAGSSVRAIEPIHAGAATVASTGQSRGCARTQITRARNLATLTGAPPPSRAIFSACEPNNGQASKTLSLNVLKLRMSWLRRKLNVIFVVAHSVITSFNDVWVRAASSLIHSARPVSLYHGIFSKPPILGAT